MTISWNLVDFFSPHLKISSTAVHCNLSPLLNLHIPCPVQFITICTYIPMLYAINSLMGLSLILFLQIAQSNKVLSTALPWKRRKMWKYWTTQYSVFHCWLRERKKVFKCLQIERFWELKMKSYNGHFQRDLCANGKGLFHFQSFDKHFLFLYHAHMSMMKNYMN